MIEAGTAVEKTCATIERKYETVIKMIDRYIKTAIEKGQFSIQIKEEIFMKELGLYLSLHETYAILRLFDEHGYTVCRQASGDICISW